MKGMKEILVSFTVAFATLGTYAYLKREIKNAGRTQNDSALEEQKFLLDADQYMRFVCHAMVRRLMEVQRTRPSDR